MLNATQFLMAYKSAINGEVIKPRGQECREVCDYMLYLDMNACPLTNFKARNLNLRYAKEEFKWYVRADKYDDSIQHHAAMWAKLKQSDGSFYSNYGQYIFPDQFNYVYNELVRDKESRRASIVLLKHEHLYHANTDTVCTYAINFRIRNDKLNMTVMMRSNDIVFGLTNDVFCFSMLYRMMYSAVKSYYRHTKVGQYHHFVNSLHVYNRHYEMLREIIAGGIHSYNPIEIPWPTPIEIANAVEFGNVYGGEWSNWLNA